MPHGLTPGWMPPVVQTAEGERFRRLEIPDSMLVMNRQRFARFVDDVRRTAWDIEELAPEAGRLVVAAGAP